MTARRVAAVDCGTNSLRLLVADVDPEAGTLRDLARQMLVVRLGEGVDATGRLSEGALARTFAGCEQYATTIRDLGAERTRFVATSATRDAENRDEFRRGVRQRMGVEPEVVSGAEEARLSFDGATRGLGGEPTPFLVVDIGGGSTELVLGSDGPEAEISVDIGCVRLTERRFREDPPSAGELAAARADVAAALDRVADAVPLDRARTLVGLAGTVTTLAAMDAGIDRYRPEVTQGYRLSAAAVHTLADRLLAASVAERRAVPVMHPGRADVIAAGALVLAAVVDRVGLPEVLVSEHDILDGIAWSMARAHRPLSGRGPVGEDEPAARGPGGDHGSHGG